MTSKEINEIVWAILKEDEKTALMLSVNHSKSTWQAGEIMGKAHYKYLEIQARAMHFYKMFTAHFTKTNGCLIPMHCPMAYYVREFFELTIQQRVEPKVAIKSIKGTPFVVASAKERILTGVLDELISSEYPDCRELYDVILEYDRWNNFRILPDSLQEPSAFKRRNKARLVKHLRHVQKLNIYHINRISERFKPSKTNRIAYLPIILDNVDNGYKVFKVGKETGIIDYISKELRLYVFDNEELADDYGYLVESYINQQTKKSCKQGQNFWPQYRNLIKQANNYNKVNNIVPKRKYLEDAFVDLDKKLIRDIEKKVQNIADPATRVNPRKLWNV